MFASARVSSRGIKAVDASARLQAIVAFEFVAVMHRIRYSNQPGNCRHQRLATIGFFPSEQLTDAMVIQPCQKEDACHDRSGSFERDSVIGATCDEAVSRGDDRRPCWGGGPFSLLLANDDMAVVLADVAARFQVFHDARDHFARGADDFGHVLFGNLAPYLAFTIDFFGQFEQ